MQFLWLIIKIKVVMPLTSFSYHILSITIYYLIGETENRELWFKIENYKVFYLLNNVFCLFIYSNQDLVMLFVSFSNRTLSITYLIWKNDITYFVHIFFIFIFKINKVVCTLILAFRLKKNNFENFDINIIFAVLFYLFLLVC